MTARAVPVPSDRRAEYRAYLQSDTWREKRAQVLARSGGTCEHCGDRAAVVHHVRYPKRLGDETPADLVAVCQRCHDLHHGVRPMNDVTTLRPLSPRTPPTGRPFECFESGGRVYASAEAWARAFGWPVKDLAHFAALITAAASSNPTWSIVHEGKAMFRWHAADDALLSFERAFLSHGYRTRDNLTRESLTRVHENFVALRNWGRDLQEEAITGAYRAGTQIAPKAGPLELIAMAIQQLAPQVVQHEAKLIEHDAEIADIRRALPAPHDPDEFVTVKQRIIEVHRDPSILPLPDCRWNLAQVVGQRLKESNAKRGPTVTARLDGSAVVTEVQTWRRADIDAVIDDVLRSRKRNAA